MNLRILLVESVPEDVVFLQDVLVEIESGRFWSNWVHIETMHASTWNDAASILVNQPIDVILLASNVSQDPGMETLRRNRIAAERAPVILLIEPEDDALAVQMVREGAQDFLIKKELDCAPLAHAIRNAVERHRLVAAMRASSTIDSLTGLPNRGGFLMYADRDRKIAERLGRRLMILVTEPKNLGTLAATYGEQRRDLALVETADHLRSVAGPTDLIARIGETHFGIAILDTDAESIEEAWARIHGAAVQHRLSVGAAIFDAEHPATLEALLEQAVIDLAPNAYAMRH
jgi:diguanylate cyclase (GGDEF)-like protein